MSEAPSSGGLCILLVDDDELDRTSVRRALRAEGIEGEILEAGDASLGLELLKSGRVHCTFLDFNMPARDGLWLVRQARAEAALAKELTAADTPLALRLLLNDAGTYDAATKTGGCDGSIVLP